MSHTIDLAVCVHCDAHLTDQERRDRRCNNCQRPVLIKQLLSKGLPIIEVRHERPAAE